MNCCFSTLLACLVDEHGIAAMVVLASRCGVVIRWELNVLVGLLLATSNAQGTFEFHHDPTSKSRLETREGLRISKTNELLPCVMSGSPL